MLKSLVSAGLILSSLSVAYAAESAADKTARAQFCDQRLSDTKSVQQLLKNHDNQMAFTNQGGIGGGGVCWWHSRYTRNAAYLVQFRPDLPRLRDEKAIKKLVGEIRKGKKIVVVPGFKNLREFSRVNYKEVLNKLEDWQETDGILHFQWLAGLSGNTKVKSDALEVKMNELYERIQKGEVVYQKLQMPGITAHAWLVVGMEKVSDGYLLEVLDSNSYRGPDVYKYTVGMESFRYYGDDFVPYTGKSKEERRLRRILNRECKDYLSQQRASGLAENADSENSDDNSDENDDA